MGDLMLLLELLRDMVFKLDEFIKYNIGFKFCIVLSYSGWYDIVNVCQKLVVKVEVGEFSFFDVIELVIEEELKMSWLGDVWNLDLLI